MGEHTRAHLNVFPGENWEIRYLPEENRYALSNPGGSDYRAGDYILFDFIGEGGSCLVYKALDTRDGGIVMIKEFYPADFAELIMREGSDLVPRPGLSEEELRRVEERFENAFRQELVNGGEVRYTGDRNNDDRFLVATNIFRREGALNRYAVIAAGAGKTLDMLDFSPSGRGRLEEILAVMLQLCQTVRAFHEKGRIHLDLNERNVFLRGADPVCFDSLRVSLIDFGSAFSVGGKREEGFRFSGSDDSAAPEQLALDFGGAAEELGRHSDVFSLVRIFRDLLARDAEKRVFPRGYQNTPPSYTGSRSLRELTGPEREELQRIVEKGSEPNPRYRYRTVEELEADLKDLRDILACRGVHPVILRRRAEERARTLGEGIRSELLCQVE